MVKSINIEIVHCSAREIFDDARNQLFACTSSSEFVSNCRVIMYAQVYVIPKW